MSFTIEAGKETGLVQINVVPKPLILCQITAVDGDTVYLCTTPSLGGDTLVYGGNTYQARLEGDPIDQIQAQSPQGYDIPGSINLQIGDGDFVIWNNHANPHGWRGGTLTVLFVLYDIPSAAFSTNAYQWTFILDKPNITAAGMLTVAAQARMSLTRLTVPNFACENMCGNVFPPDGPAGDPDMYRRDALTNPTSLYYGCGYSAGLTGGFGNLTTANLTNPNGSALTNSAGKYVMCDYTRSCGAGKGTLTQGCMARLGNYSATVFHGGSIPCAADGDIIDDESGNRTGHFTGDTWLAPVGWQGHQYVNPSAGNQYGFNATNPATGSTYYNQGYGVQWVTATVLAPAGDPNTDRAECIVCLAPIGAANIRMVLVNGVTVSLFIPNTGMDPLFCYHILSAGGRSSTVSVDEIYDGQGDPHGSMCWIEVVVPVELQAAGSLLNVQVLVQFPQCLHAMPVASAAPSGSDAIVTFTAGTTNVDFQDGVAAWLQTYPGGTVYIKGNSGIPDGAYGVVSATTGPPGAVTISGGAFTGTGGGAFYYPANTADAAMVDSKGNAAANPVWALMDLLTWGPFTVANFDVQSWYNAAQICATPITYTDINGNSATHARYRCSLVLQTAQRMSMAKAVLSLRNCAGIILALNPANGLLQCFIEETLADQQPLPINGSNYNIPVPSVTAAGNPTLTGNITSGVTTIPLSSAFLPTLSIIQIGSEQMQITGGQGTSSLTVTRAYNSTTAASHLSGATVVPCGFLAYSFDGGNGSIEEGTFKLGGASLNDTPNTVAFPFQDSANAWVQDSCTTIDPKGYITSGDQEIAAALQILGIENFDQATRMSNIALAKSLYGNSRFDACGTELPSYRSTAKAAHLASRVGFIVGVTYEQMQL